MYDRRVCWSGRSAAIEASWHRDERAAGWMRGAPLSGRRCGHDAPARGLRAQRHAIAASFLTKHLANSERRGRRTIAGIRRDPARQWGGSGCRVGCDAQPYFRIFNRGRKASASFLRQLRARDVPDSRPAASAIMRRGSGPGDLRRASSAGVDYPRPWFPRPARQALLDRFGALSSSEPNARRPPAKPTKRTTRPKGGVAIP